MARLRELFLTVAIDDRWLRLHVLYSRCDFLSHICDPACCQDLRPSTALAGKSFAHVSKLYLGIHMGLSRGLFHSQHKQVRVR